MGKRGPQPKPTKMKRMAGNPGMRPLNSDEPEPRGLAVPPDWLGTEARVEWDRVAPELERMGILTSVDQAMFAAYCQSYAEYARAVTKLNELEVSYLHSWTGPGRHPIYAIVSDSAQRLNRFANAFGMSPAARPAIAAKPKAEANLDEFVGSKPKLRVAE